MLSPKTQRYLGWIATIGTLTACFGCGLLSNNQVNAANAFLILAWLILVPLFVYLIVVRRQGKAELRRVTQQREDQRQRELAALGSVQAAMRERAIDDEG